MGYKKITTPFSPARPATSTSVPSLSLREILGNLSPSCNVSSPSVSGSASFGASATSSATAAGTAGLALALDWVLVLDFGSADLGGGADLETVLVFLGEGREVGLSSAVRYIDQVHSNGVDWIAASSLLLPS